MRIGVALLALLPAAATATVRYAVTADVSARTFGVSITLDHPATTETFRIPGWSPGFYVMQKYAPTLSDVRASDERGHPLPVEHPDERSWVIHPRGKQITFRYRVLADDPGLGFFGSSIRKDVAFMNPPSALMTIDARLSEGVELSVKAPKGWQVASPLPERDGAFVADGYDELADSPVQMGRFVERRFEVEGIPIHAIWVALPNETVLSDVDTEVAALKQLSATTIRFFGGAAFKRYMFVFHRAYGGFMGGLEHRASTVIALPNERIVEDLAELTTHEFFHAWNVKQIRPAVLGPFDYQAPARTGNLWFAEGVTDYYAKILTYRSGVADQAWLFDQLTDQISTLQRGRTRRTKTVEDASRAVWENGGFDLGDLDYYNKGLVAGFVLDAAIREATNGAKSLDDVMRLMYGRYRLPQPGYDEDGILKAINEVAGKDLTPLYQRIVRTTQEVPYEGLTAIGLRLTLPTKSSGTTPAKGYRLEIDPDATPEAAARREAWLRRP